MKRLVAGLLMCSSAAVTPVLTGNSPGPLHTLTIATNSLEETRLFYETDLGLRMEGPITVPVDVKDAQRKLWQMPDDLDWSLHVLHRDGVEYAAQIRLLVLDKLMPAIRQSWKPFEFAQLLPPGDPYRFFIFIAFRNLEMTKGTIPPRLPGRGLALYSLDVGDLAAARSREGARGITEISGPVEVASPANGTRRHATLIAPNGVMFELFE